jgi:hypothetical protein
MDELIRQVAERTGIGEEQARTAVETVVGFLKQRLPESAAGLVDAAMSGQQTSGGLGDVAGRLGGLLGGE